MNLRYLIKYIVIILLTVSLANSTVIFEDSFDNHSDWSSEAEYDVNDIWPDSRLTTLGGIGSLTDIGWISHSAPNSSNDMAGTKPLYEVNSELCRGGSGKCLHYNHENNSYMNGGNINVYLGGGPTGGNDELYISYWIKFPENWNLWGVGDFYKLFRVYTGIDPENDTYGGPSGTYKTQADYDAGIKRGQIMIFYIIRDGDDKYRYETAFLRGYRTGSNADYGDDDGYYDYTEFEHIVSSEIFDLQEHLGEWVYVQTRIKLNDVGSANGVMNTWLIPEPDILTYDVTAPTVVWDVNNAQLTSNGTVTPEQRFSPDRHMNAVIFSDNISSTGTVTNESEQTILLDDVVISTAPVGPYYVIGSTIGPTRSGGLPTGGATVRNYIKNT